MALRKFVLGHGKAIPAEPQSKRALGIGTDLLYHTTNQTRRFCCIHAGRLKHERRLHAYGRCSLRDGRSFGEENLWRYTEAYLPPAPLGLNLA